MKLSLIVVATAALVATAAFAGGDMKSADSDGDGFVSLAEHKAAHATRIEEQFARMDTNADGLLSDDELRTAHDARRGEHDRKHKGKHHRKMNPEKMVERLDTDGSGSVSLTELEGKRFSPDADTFYAADTNSSGELDATELQAMMKSHWAERRDTRND